MNKSIRNSFALLFLIILFFSFGSDRTRTKRGWFYADESSYFSITQSIACDYDIKYTRDDIIRIREKFPDGPQGLFLKKGTDGDIYYAKSYAYPLFAAPFYRLFGLNGIFFLNGLMLFFALYMGYLLLKQYHDEWKSFIFSCIFIFSTVTPVYLSWITADLFNFFTLFAGLFFFFYKFSSFRGGFYLSAVFFAMSAFSKPNMVVPIGVIYLILLLRREWKKFIVLVLIAGVICSLFLGYYYFQTGEFNYQAGIRKSFYHKFPFERSDYRFEEMGHGMSLDNYGDRYYVSPKIVVANIFYYFFGRYSGMGIYFSSALFLLILFFFQKKKPEDWVVLAAISAGILLYVIGTPDNYLGGSGTVGNRYFLTLFPLFFFLGYKTRIFKSMMVPAIVGAVMLTSVFAFSAYRSSPAKFAGLTFPINMFPPEKTQYNSLPFNENPHARRREIFNSPFRHWLYFINEQFWPKEGNCFWTYGDGKQELFLLAEKHVKEFSFIIINGPDENRVYVEVDGKEKSTVLKARERRVITIKGHEGFVSDKNRYLYYVKVGGDESFKPFYTDENSKDPRLLGINIEIKVK